MTRRKDAQPDEPLIGNVTEPFVTEAGPVPDAAPEAAPVPDVAPEVANGAPRGPVPARRRAGVAGPLLGGAIAAIGGFALSHFDVLGLAVPDASADLAALAARLDDAAQRQAGAEQRLGSDLAALSDRVTGLEAAPAAEPPDLSRLESLDQRLAAIEAIPSDGNAATAALAGRIAELESRIASLPAGGSDPALQQKLDDALARLAEAEAKATTRADEAQAAARAAARANALDDLSDAVASGKPFATQLQAFADPALTDALGPLADSGVPTLAELQETFPDAARDALRIARDVSTEDGWGARLVDFLAAQTSARPLTPLAGNTPDAILSRAEFALSEGRVADALAELAALDPAAGGALDPWVARAGAHLAAAAALQTARGE